MDRRKLSLTLVLGCFLFAVTAVLAQGPAPAQIQAAIRQLLASDAVVTGDWSCTGTCTGFGGGGGTPGGSDTQVQFNDAGAFGGDAGLTFDKTTDTLTIPNIAGSVVSIIGSSETYIGGGVGGVTLQATNGTIGLVASGGGQVINLNAETVSILGLTATSSELVAAVPLTIGDEQAVRTDTTTAHTAVLQAYDVNGTAYKTFATLTNGDVPSFAIVPPAGGTVALQGVFAANDGTAGLTQTCATPVTAVTVKNGLITAITCP